MVNLEDYKKLDSFDIVELWKRQKILDDTFDEKPTGKKRTRTELRISYFDDKTVIYSSSCYRNALDLSGSK